jgi:hypothetical protein
MRSYFTNRRHFFCSIAGLAVSVVVPKLPFEIKQWSKTQTVDRDFMNVNGWVLTREDCAAREVTRDVV